MIVEILSPSNTADTRAAVVRYMTMPSVQEILVLHSMEVRAELWQRVPDARWMMLAADDEVLLNSIGLSVRLGIFYRSAGTR